LARFRSWISGFLVVGTLLLAFATSVHADHEHLIDPATHGHDSYWSWHASAPPAANLNVTYWLDTGTLDAAMQARTLEAIAVWNASGMNYTLVDGGASGSNIDITYGAIDGAGNVLGQANVSYFVAHSGTYPDGTSHHRISSAPITMDSAETWYTGTGAPGGGQFDWLSVMTHELGHSLGLGHANAGTEPNSIMLPTISAGTARRTLTQDDLNAIILTSSGSGAAPEPGTLALFAAGVGVVGILRRCRRRDEVESA
jgi:hypothetical protein